MINMINHKGQNTAEYALLIALVIAGIIAMQTYAQRSMQARMKGASMYLVDKTKTGSQDGTQKDILGNISQYEPYYLNSTYEVDRKSEETQVISSTSKAGSAEGKSAVSGIVASSATTDRDRRGQQASDYAGEVGVLTGE